MLFRICSYNFAVTKFIPFCYTEDIYEREAGFRRFLFCISFPQISRISLKDPFREQVNI